MTAALALLIGGAYFALRAQRGMYVPDALLAVAYFTVGIGLFFVALQ